VSNEFGHNLEYVCKAGYHYVSYKDLRVQELDREND